VNHDIKWSGVRKDSSPNELTQSTFELVPIHCRVASFGNYDPDAGMCQRGSDGSDVEELCPSALPLS